MPSSARFARGASRARASSARSHPPPADILRPSATKADLTLPVVARRITPESFVADFVFAAVAVMAGGYLLDLLHLPIPPLALGPAGPAPRGSRCFSSRRHPRA